MSNPQPPNAIQGLILAALPGMKFRVMGADSRERICRLPGSGKKRSEMPYFHALDIVWLVPDQLNGDKTGKITGICEKENNVHTASAVLKE